MGWTRRRRKWAVLLGLLVAVTTVIVCVLLWQPISEEQSGYTMIGWQLYAFESVDIYSSPWVNVTFRGVLFEFPPPMCPLNSGGGNVCGDVVESNGTSFSFDIALPPPCSGAGTWLTWVAPDHHEAIELEVCGGSAAHVLVEA
jgi:hypothetical protein